MNKENTNTFLLARTCTYKIKEKCKKINEAGIDNNKENFDEHAKHGRKEKWKQKAKTRGKE